MLKEDSKLCPKCLALLGKDGACPKCGYGAVADGDYDAKYLRPGMVLDNGRYLVGMLVRKNGEGAVYDGFDYQTRETCWIREYFPTRLTRRNASTGEVIPAEGAEAQYKALFSDFVDVCNEVKRLGVTERVVPIRDVFNDKNTVYAVYGNINVISFAEYLSGIGGKLPLRKALEIFLPFCNMVGGIHDHGYIHRGISPFTVYIDEDDRLYLWDFALGATRTAGSELDAELFNGYSAPEQYSPSGWQGAWTDIYALAAMFYRMVSGFVPPKSTLVGEARPVAPLEDLVMDVPKNISEAVRDAMAVNTENRTQSVYSFVSRLTKTEVSNTAVYDTPRARKRPDAPQEPTQKRPAEREERETRRSGGSDGGFKYAIIALILTVFALIGGLWLLMGTYFPQFVEQESLSQPASHSASEFESPSEEPEESSGQEDIAVPRFVGQMYSLVENDSNYTDRYEFSVKEEYNDDFPEGVIFNQSPDPDTPMPNRGTVILYVSKGRELIEMPDIVGMQYEDALLALGELGLSCEKMDRFSQGAEPNSVVRTTPAAGEKFDPKSQVISVFVMPGSPSSEQSGGGESSSSGSSSSRRASSSESSSGGIRVE